MTSWKPGHIRRVRYQLSECDGAINRARYWLNVGEYRKAQDEIIWATSKKHEAMRAFPFAECDEDVTFEYLYSVFYYKDSMMQMAQVIAEFIAGTGQRPGPDLLTIPEIIARLDDITQRAVDLAKLPFDPACLAHLNKYIAEMRNFKQYLQQTNPPDPSALYTLAGVLLMHELNFFTCVYGVEMSAGTIYQFLSGMDYWLMNAYLTIRKPGFGFNDTFQVLLMLGEAESLKHQLLHDYIPRLTDGSDPYPPPHDSGEHDLPPTPPDYASARPARRTKATAKKRPLAGKKGKPRRRS
jgi:hypothetical protein